MKSKKIVVLILAGLLAGCSTHDSQKETKDPESPQPKSCMLVLQNMMANDNFEHIEGTTKWQRGGTQRNQMIIDLSEQTVLAHDPEITYHASADQEIKEDEFLYYYDYKEDRLQHTLNEINDEDYAVLYKNDWRTLFDHYEKRLEDAGCPSMAGMTASKMEKLNELDSNLKSLSDDNSYLPPSILSCKGLECSVMDHDKFVELPDWKDLSVPNGSHLDSEENKYMYKSLKKGDQDILNLVGYNVIMTFQKFNSEPVSYEESLSMDLNPLVVQNFVRDLYYKYSDSVGPYLYFVFIDSQANRPIQSDEGSLDYTKMTYDSWKQNVPNTMHQFWQQDEGRIEYEMANVSDREILKWLWNRIAEDDAFDLDSSILTDYIKIYDYNWQRINGVRELFYDRYGF